LATAADDALLDSKGAVAALHRAPKRDDDTAAALSDVSGLIPDRLEL
jgi:hypothetical protein